MAYGFGWAPYVPVAERRRQAAREVEKLRKAGHAVAPVVIAGRRIAGTFWGKAWCETLESYRDFENRLPRGRTYVRNGSVIDLQIAPQTVTALVSGSSIYRVAVAIAAVPAEHWQALCRECSGAVDSLVDLLQGRFSKAVMERLCRQDTGLFPRPRDIRFSCSCPDHASLCKHVAAVLYGVGARLDSQPELLFRLRGVDGNDLLSRLDQPPVVPAPAPGRVLEGDDLAALFGLDMAEPFAGAGEPEPAKRPAKRKAAAPAAVPVDKDARNNARPRRPKPDLELTPDGYVKWWK